MLNGPPKTRAGAKRAVSRGMLAPYRVLVEAKRITETISSVNQRGGLQLRGILSRQQDSAPRRGGNLPRTLFAEIPKREFKGLPTQPE